MSFQIRTGLGQDSHAFDFNDQKKKLLLAAVVIENSPPLKGNSDADVVLHAITNSISSISGIPILGALADELCFKETILDSKIYLGKALETIVDWKISNIAISIECQNPKLLYYFDKMKQSLSTILLIQQQQIGITATSGEELTDFGRGKGIQAIAITTVTKF